MKQYTVSEYAKAMGLTNQAVTWQVRNNRLPEGITGKMFGKMYILESEKDNLPDPSEARGLGGRQKAKKTIVEAIKPKKTSKPKGKKKPAKRSGKK